MSGRLVLLCFGLLAAGATVAPAQNALRWGADAEGGQPYIFADPGQPDKVIGFEVDIVRALEKELGIPIEFKQRQFQNLVQDLEQGEIDFAMNGLEVTPDRKKKVLFTDPYYHYQLQLAVRPGEERFDSLTGLQKIGGVVGTLDNTAASRYLESRGIRLRPYDDQQGPYWDLAQGEIDAVLMDLPIALYVGRENKFNRDPPEVMFAGHIFGQGDYAIAVKQGNEALKKKLDAGLARLREKGVLKEIYDKWKLWQDDSLPSGEFREFDEERGEAVQPSQNLPHMLWLLVEGAWMTIKITALGFALAVAIGLLVVIVRLYAPPGVSWLAVVYVEFFRGIPVLLLLAFLYYGLPQIGIASGLGNLLKFPAFWVAVVGFGLNYAAYEAEIYRAGIGSVPRGQWEAARSLGMSDRLTFRRIVLPQAVKFILPPMTNDLVAMFKDTSVVSVIAVVELTKQYLILTRSSTAHLVTIALATAGLYLVMSVPLGLLSRYLEKHWDNQGKN